MSAPFPFAGPDARLADVPDLIVRGELDEAARRCADVLQAAPGHALAEYFAGVVAYERGADRDAEDALRRALLHGGNPSLRAAAWQGLARLHERRAETGRALEALAKAVEAEPASAPHRARLAEALLGAGRFEEAETVARSALRIDPADGPSCGVLAECLVRRGRFEEALAALGEAERLLGAKPAARASVLGLRARIAAMRGDLAVAETSYRAALDADPGYPGYAALAEVHAFRDRDDPLLKRLLEAEARTPGPARVDLAYALGKAWEDLGEAERAFASYAEGARLARPAHASRAVEGIEARAAALEKGFGRDFLAAAEGVPPGDWVPVFIVGLPRGGSTLLEQMLAAHPGIAAGGELPHAQRFAQSLLASWYEEGACPPGGRDAIVSALTLLAGRYAEETAPLRRGRGVFTDKALANYQYAGILAAAFPRAVFLHAYKEDALDQCWGIFRRNLDRHEYGYDFADLARVHRSYRRLVAHWRETLGEGRFLDVPYERLVTEPEEVLRRILDALGLPFDPACLHPETVDRPVATASLVQIRRPVHRERIGSARAFAPRLEPLRALLEEREDPPPKEPS